MEHLYRENISLRVLYKGGPILIKTKEQLKQSRVQVQGFKCLKKPGRHEMDFVVGNYWKNAYRLEM